MATSENPIPLILCGLQEAIGSKVIEGLKPEYEVVQFIKSVPACIAEIPVLIRGEKTATKSSELGSGNVSPARRPVAVVLGGGYHPHFDEVHDAVEAECVRVGASSSGVAWLRQDGTKPAPTVGTPEYAKAQMLRVRELLARLLEEGQLGNGEMKVHWY